MSKTGTPTSRRSNGSARRSWCSASSIPSDVADSAGARRAHRSLLLPTDPRLAPARQPAPASVAAIAPAATTAGGAVRSSPPPLGRRPSPSRAQERASRRGGARRQEERDRLACDLPSGHPPRRSTQTPSASSPRHRAEQGAGASSATAILQLVAKLIRVRNPARKAGTSASTNSTSNAQAIPIQAGRAWAKRLRNSPQPGASVKTAAAIVTDPPASESASRR